MRIGRRALLLGAAGGGLVAGCGGPGRPEVAERPSGSRRTAYGQDPSQYADLRMPAGTPLATVVLLHGGYWLPEYAADQLDPMAEALTALGYATWNVEYRRTGAGGGVPATLDDVAAALDRLAGDDLPAGLDRTVLAVGHSAGGHLAAWLAARDADADAAPAVPLAGAVSLSGVLALARLAAEQGPGGPVQAFVGGSPDDVPDQYALADPTLLGAPGCPVVAAQAEDDQVVPAAQARAYVDAVAAAGGQARVVSLPGDHFTIIDPEGEAFPVLRRLLDEVRPA